MNDPVRLAKVDALVNAMLEDLSGGPEIIDANAAEVLSAAMTVCLRMVKASLAQGADPAGIRRGLDCIYLACAGDVVH